MIFQCFLMILIWFSFESGDDDKESRLCLRTKVKFSIKKKAKKQYIHQSNQSVSASFDIELKTLNNHLWSRDCTQSPTFSPPTGKNTINVANDDNYVATLINK